MTQNSDENSEMNSFLPPTAIGFVGLGNMGYPMAKRLAAAGYVLTVFDLASDVVTQFCQETEATAAESLEALGQSSSVVLLVLHTVLASRSCGFALFCVFFVCLDLCLCVLRLCYACVPCVGLCVCPSCVRVMCGARVIVC